MATPAEKLSDSLAQLKELQDQGFVAIKSDALSRTNRERLLENNFIEEVFKGWYIPVSPNATYGDSSTWYNNYWDFCAQYLDMRFGKEWTIYPEQSLLLHAGNTAVPTQLMVRSPLGSNQNIPLPHNTSLFLFKAELQPADEMVENNGLRLYSLPAALIRCSQNTFLQNPIDTRTALSMIGDTSEILTILLDGGHSVIAGRLAGAFRNLGKERLATNILDTMQKAGYDVRETDPFDTKLTTPLSSRIKSPYENRIRLMWDVMRSKILPNFPASPDLPADFKSYLKNVDAIYVTDAYHSLSIEKYLVTPELIESVRSGNWDVKGNEMNQKQRDAMAAKGYYDAFKSVKKSIYRILKGENAGHVADEDHGTWYRELFGPSVSAGILKPSDLAGYRNHQVYIGGSMHTPLNKEAVRDSMAVLFQLLAEEKEAFVRAVLGHFIFVFIHPYMDGNGRIGRLLMNVMLASGGYPWTVIPVEQRDEYMKALEIASVKGNIEPFAKFVGILVAEGMKGSPVANINV